MKKPIYKRRWFIVLAVFIFIGVVGSLVEDDTETVKTVETTVESITTNEAPKEEAVQPEVSSEAPKEEVAQPDNSAIVLSILQKGYSEIGTVQYDEDQNAYIITPTATDFIEDLQYTLSSGDIEDWNSLVSALMDLSKTITETVGTGTSIAMANPLKTENVILIITDGVLVYDAVAESVNQ